MKLIRFEASRVFGYLNFNIRFNDDLSFVVGVNGAGKTTVIRLIQALLTASVRDLNLIEFKTAQLEFYGSNGSNAVRTISATTTSEYIEVKLSTVKDPLLIPKLDIEELENGRRESGRSTSLYEELGIETAKSAVGKALSELDAPVILGLERRVPNTALNERTFPAERVTYFSGSPRGRKRSFQGTLGVSLMETQALVLDAYRQVRRIQDQSNEHLRDKILLSAFTYTPVDSLKDIMELSSIDKQNSILARRGEIEKILAGLDTSGVRLQHDISDFFDRFTRLFDRINQSGNKHEFDLELLINKAQIDRIMGVIDLVDQHKSQIAKGMTSINNFLNLMNNFYSDTEKKIGIDPVGWLQIERKDGITTSVEALSSGERQLLIIFANLMFGRYGRKKGVFIIDEPELSLHLKWQEAFIFSMLHASPETQLIVATHSPEIVGDYTSKCVSLIGE